MLDLKIGDYNWDLSFEDVNCDAAEVLTGTALREILEEFYALTGMAIAIIDTEGKVLISNGWQDICHLFHRKHPESCKNCTESDTVLSKGVAPGEFKLYKCKNGMWDIVTPIYVQGRHLANLYFGQFFFEGEQPDTQFFEEQAARYGFNRADYMQALRQVPFYSREQVAKVMSFYLRLARHISQLSHSNVVLSHNLKVKAGIIQAQKLQSMMLDQIKDRIVLSDLEGNITYTNQAVQEAMGYSKDELCRMRVHDFEHGHELDGTQDEIIRCTLINGSWHGEAKNITKDGNEIFMDIRTFRIDDDAGKPLALCGISSDITVRRLYIDLLRRQNEASRKLIEISRQLLNTKAMSIAATIDSCLLDLGEFMEVDRSYVFLIDESGITISNTNEWCRQGVEAQKDFLQKQDLRSAPGMIEELLKQNMVCIDDLSVLESAWAEDRAVLAAQGIQALLAAPIVYENEIMGFIGLDMVRAARHWDEVDFMLIQLTADLLAASLARG